VKPTTESISRRLRPNMLGASRSSQDDCVATRYEVSAQVVLQSMPTGCRRCAAATRSRPWCPALHEVANITDTAMSQGLICFMRFEDLRI